MTNSDSGPGGPKPDQPDDEFQDGDHLYEVSVTPAKFPLRLTREPNTSFDFGIALLYLVVAMTVGLVGRLFDRRWKVVVSRRRSDARATWVAVAAEFVNSAQVAEERRAAILTGWRPGQYAEAWAIPDAELRRARRAGERVIPSRDPL